MDELAKLMGKDPSDLRLDLLKQAKENPVGKTNDYDPDRYAGVLTLLREKSGWDKPENKAKNRGVAAHFCHNSYAGHVVEMTLRDEQPCVQQIYSAVDCGVVVNPEAARNMVEGVVANALHKTTGKRFYRQPFGERVIKL